MPRDIFDDENVAYAWYENAGVWHFGGIYGGAIGRVPVGVGKTPSIAFEDLIARLRRSKPVRSSPAPEDYEVAWPDGHRTEVRLYDRAPE